MAKDAGELPPERPSEQPRERLDERPSTAQRRVVGAALLLYLVFLAGVGLWATTIDTPVRGQLNELIDWLQRAGAPSSLRYVHVELAANVLVFVPVGFLVALLLPARRWWLAALAGLCLSAGIELAQFVLLHARIADPVDLVTNTVGAFAGAVAGGLVQLWRTRRRAHSRGIRAHSQGTPSR